MTSRARFSEERFRVRQLFGRNRCRFSFILLLLSHNGARVQHVSRTEGESDEEDDAFDEIHNRTARATRKIKRHRPSNEPSIGCENLRTAPPRACEIQLPLSFR